MPDSNIEKIEKLAEKVRKMLNLKYDEESVKYLEGFIERVKVQMPKDEWDGLINSCSAFLGQCIIKNYGGRWQEKDGTLMIAFDSDNFANPHSKVSKQFENGPEDSIHSFYRVIPTVFKPAPWPKTKKWWPF